MSDTAQLEKIRTVQKDAWNKASAGWKKWDVMMMDFLKPMNIEMIQQLRLNEGDVVLDIATGTGEPGLTIAAQLKHGKVIGTDLAEEMLSVAVEKAEVLGIKNFETVCCDVSNLPFENDTFNAISCRLGFMFFPDIQIALNEMVRVLKPGGRLVVSVWDASDKNFWINASMETMISGLGLTPPATGSPGPFRCAEPGFMAAQFELSGLKNIEEKQLSGKLKCDSIATYWSFITEVATPVAFSKADDTLKMEIQKEILEKVKSKCPDGNVEMESCAILVCGEK